MADTGRVVAQRSEQCQARRVRQQMEEVCLTLRLRLTFGFGFGVCLRALAPALNTSGMLSALWLVSLGSAGACVCEGVVSVRHRQRSPFIPVHALVHSRAHMRFHFLAYAFFCMSSRARAHSCFTIRCVLHVRHGETSLIAHGRLQ